MSKVFSPSRPLHGAGTQTPQHSSMHNYAYDDDLQELLQKLLTDVLCDQPSDAIEFMIKWLQQEQKRRIDEGLASLTAAKK
jgi:hypothetical protein